MSVCPCGLDWQAIELPRDQNANELVVSARMAELSGLIPKKPHLFAEHTHFLDEFNLDGFSRGLVRFVDLCSQQLAGRSVSVKAENLICHRAMVNAIRALKDWPETFQNQYFNLSDMDAEDALTTELKDFLIGLPDNQLSLDLEFR